MKKSIQIFFYSLISLGFLISCKKETKKADIKNHENYLTNTHWLIRNDKLIGLDSDETQFILYKRNDTAQIWNFSAVEFTDKEKFRSYNSWECGNDCFIAIDGKYKFIEKSEIEFQIEKISKTGICEEPPEYLSKPTIIIVKVEKSSDSLILNKK